MNERKKPTAAAQLPDEERSYYRVSAVILGGWIIVGRHGDQAFHPTFIYPHRTCDLARAHPGAPQMRYLFL